jgi:hypothetical protein
MLTLAQLCDDSPERFTFRLETGDPSLEVTGECGEIVGI